MIIGNGSIAKLLHDRDDCIFFASGVSDSQSKVHNNEMIKESILLGNNIELANKNNLMFVYFGTISMFMLRTSYTEHKKTMESIVQKLAVNYTIIRLGNVWECTNPNTFLNVYKRKPFEPRDEFKFMINKEQLQLITDGLPKTGQHQISIFGEMLKVKTCVKNTEFLIK